jgi:hypothetical protein
VLVQLEMPIELAFGATSVVAALVRSLSRRSARFVVDQRA